MLTIAELLTIAAVTEGRYGQASMAGGPEHIGHPTVACCRIDDDPLPGWEPVVFPDAVIVRDAALLHVSDVFHGLGADGFILLDSSTRP
ncbi:2-oxoacid:acceptor oxidoreductase family protein [Frankia sp. KB5]|uniref:2-oxoacid:acceptor oxidoreductase family protein n=1 Tax=Frankia sp. KB5 TaxID=683318 RepID=UPI002410C15F|nr:2-oxoacid:acceptor oxidoreductase family protein [Frankia sp. KB5]